MTVPTQRSAPAPSASRDFDGLYKALLEAHPREALDLLCGARLDGGAVILDGPTEQPRQRSRQCDKVFLVRHGGGRAADVYHFEVQVERTGDFQERMVFYWAGLAVKYSRDKHRIHQIVLWPLGGGCPGSFRRDQVQLEYRSINVPEDLDPDVLLGSPLAPLALWSRKPPPDVVKRVVDQIEATGAGEEQLVQIGLGLLAEEALGTQVIEELRRRGMSSVLEQSDVGREIARRNREEGLEQGLVTAMRTLLRVSYGDFADLDELARRLTDRDHDGSMARIVAGATLEELRA